jgi:hypothetical protein
MASQRQLPPSKRRERQPSKISSSKRIQMRPEDCTADTVLKMVQGTCEMIVQTGLEIPITAGYIHGCEAEFIIPNTDVMTKPQCDTFLRTYRAQQKCDAVVVYSDVYLNMDTEITPEQAKRLQCDLSTMRGTVEAAFIVYETAQERRVCYSVITTVNGRRALTEWKPMAGYQSIHFGNYYPQN